MKVNKPLQSAARDHAKYIAGINRLSHTQPTKAKERARQRVEHYGGKMQGIGENTAFIGIGSRMIYPGRNGADTPCTTYLIDKNFNRKWDCGTDRMDFDCPSDLETMWDFVVEYE